MSAFYIVFFIQLNYRSVVKFKSLDLKLSVTHLLLVFRLVILFHCGV